MVNIVHLICVKFISYFQLGPEKGVMHLAVAAVVNALWDLWAKIEGKVRQTIWIGQNIDSSVLQYLLSAGNFVTFYL